MSIRVTKIIRPMGRMLEPHLYTAYGTFTAASSSVNIVEVTASTYSAHDTEAQAALLGYAPTTRPPKRSSNNKGSSRNTRRQRRRRRRLLGRRRERARGRHLRS
jgi:hypothetical protein